MSLFEKKNHDASLKILSEEEIQRKLYGNYRPGTLGNVIKAGEDELKREVSDKKETDDGEPTLFSDISLSSGVSGVDARYATVKDEIEEDFSHVFKKQEPVLNEDVLIDDQDEEMFKITVEKDDQQKSPSSQDAKFSSFRITLDEFWDALKSFGLKYFLFGAAVLFGLVLLFNILSTYIKDDQRDVDYDVVTAQSGAVIEGQDVQSVPLRISDKGGESRSVVSTPVVPTVKSGPDVVVLGQRDGVNDSQVTGTVHLQQKGSFSIQLCVSNSHDATKVLVADFRDQGYDAFYQKNTTRSGKELFFVYVGSFADRQDAEKALLAYKKDPAFKRYADCFVTNVKRS